MEATRMVGQIELREGKGRGGLSLSYFGPLTVLTVSLWERPGCPERRTIRRLTRIERRFLRQGVGRVILPEGFPYAHCLTRLRPVETLPFYRAVADLLALGALDSRGVPKERGRVALAAPWLCPELTATAERLCPQVRELVIYVPGEGEEYARWLHGQYGLPVAPPSAPADVTVAFGPGGPRQGAVLSLYGAQVELFGLTVAAPDYALPGGYDQSLLALLWEAGSLDRERLTIAPAEDVGLRATPTEDS